VFCEHPSGQPPLEDVFVSPTRYKASVLGQREQLGTELIMDGANAGQIQSRRASSSAWRLVARLRMDSTT